MATARRLWTRRAGWTTLGAAGASVGLAIFAAAAFANAANPLAPSTGTISPGPTAGSVRVDVSGTWDWGELSGSTVQTSCTGRYAVDWSVDWWGLSGSSTATAIPNLVGSVVTPGTSTAAPAATEGSLTPDGAWQIKGTGQYFHTSSLFNGVDTDLCGHKDAQGFPAGSWSAYAIYPNEQSVPSKLCVNMYDPHGTQGKWSTSASDNHASLDGDNSIKTNEFDAGQAAYCFTPSFSHPLSIGVDKTNDADGNGTFTKTETATVAGQAVTFHVKITNTSTTAKAALDLPVKDQYAATTLNVCDGSTSATVTADDNLTGTVLNPGDNVTCSFTIAGYAPGAGSLTDTAIVNAHESGVPGNTASGQSTSTVNAPAPNPATLGSKILLCTGGTPVNGGNLHVSGGPTSIADTPQLAATTVDPGTYTVTATAPAHYALVACGSYNGSPTQSATIKAGDNKELDFFVAPIAPQLSVAKDGPATGLLADNGTYHLVVTNSGTDASAANTVTDTLPTGETFVTAGSDPACSAAGQTVTCTVGPLAASGGKQSFTVVVSYSKTGDLTDCATINGQPNPSCVTTTVQAPDVTVAKSGPATGVLGGNGTYTIVATNNGTAASKATTFTDTLPAGETFVTAGSDPACSAAGQTVTCNLGPLAAGGGKQSFTVVVSYSATGALTDCATINGQPNPSCVTTTVGAPNVEVVKSGPATGVLGDTGSYTLVATNIGNAPSTPTTVFDQLPAGETFVAAGSDPACSANGQIVSCTLGALAAKGTAGDSQSFTVVVRYTDSGDQTDCASAPGQATPSCVTTHIPGAPSLSLVKTNDANGDGVFTDTEVAPTAGGAVTFQVTVTNTSKEDITIDSVTDAYGSTSTGVCANLVGQVLKAGASVSCQFTIQGYAPAAGDSLTDTVTVSGHDSSGATTSAKDTSTVTTATPPTPGAPDLAIVKSASASTVTVGDTLTYTLTVSNVGLGATSNPVTVTDTLPTGLTLVGVNGGTDWSCATSGLAVTCTYLGGAIQPGQTVGAITVTTTVLSSAPTILTNTGVVAVLGDTNPTNNQSTVKTPVTKVLGVKIPKTPATPTPTTPPAVLPFTGSNASQLLPVGLVTLLMGAGLLIAGRRRRRVTA